jgi:hypothetical protein
VLYNADQEVDEIFELYSSRIFLPSDDQGWRIY